MHKADSKKPSLALNGANFFGALGYVSLLFEWLWVFGILLYPLAKGWNFALPPTDTPATPPPPLLTINGTVAFIIGIIVTAACLALVAYAFFSVPRTIAEGGAQVTRRAATAFIPVITHHKPVSKKRMKRLTFKLVTSLKALAIAIPLAVCAAVPTFAVLTQQIISIVALFFAAWAFVNFGVQLAITKVAAVDTEKVW